VDLPPVLGEDQGGDGDRQERGKRNGNRNRDDEGEQWDGDESFAEPERGADQRGGGGDADHRKGCGIGEHVRLTPCSWRELLYPRPGARPRTHQAASSEGYRYRSA
jgi:hypothetical protein